MSDYEKYMLYLWKWARTPNTKKRHHLMVIAQWYRQRALCLA